MVAAVQTVPTATTTIVVALFVCSCRCNLSCAHNRHSCWKLEVVVVILVVSSDGVGRGGGSSVGDGVTVSLHSC